MGGGAGCIHEVAAAPHVCIGDSVLVAERLYVKLSINQICFRKLDWDFSFGGNSTSHYDSSLHRAAPKLVSRWHCCWGLWLRDPTRQQK